MAKRRATRPFGQEVRHLIAEKNVTLRGVAAQIGVDPGFLVRVLQGKQPPSHKLLDGVSEAFDLPENYFVEARREKLSGLLSRSSALVDAFYNQVAPERVVDTSRGRANPGRREPLDSPLAILALSDASEPRLAQLGAAVLLRYQSDEAFRHAVDAQLPEMKRIAQELSAAD